MLFRQRYSHLLRIMAMESYNRQPWGLGSSSSPTPAAVPVPEQHHSKDYSIGVKVIYTPPSEVQPVVEYVSHLQLTFAPRKSYC